MADKGQFGAKCEGWRQVYSERRFGILLVILAVLLAGSPVLFGFGLSGGWFDGLMALILLPAIQSFCFERRQRMFALLLGIPTIVICLGGHALSGTASLSVLFVGHLCGVLFLFGSAGVIVKSLFNSRSLTFDSIYRCSLWLPVCWPCVGNFLFDDRNFPARFFPDQRVATHFWRTAPAVCADLL